MEEDKENNMSDGNVGASDAAVLALLADTSRAGRGGGMYGGGGYGEGGYGGYGAGMFAGFASNAVRTNAVGDQVVRNGQDAHFFALSSEDRSHFNILNQQAQAAQLASQAQISQLALQLCQCCGDTKAALGKIEGRLDCLEQNIPNNIQIQIHNQTIADLRAQLSNGGGNGWPYATASGPPYGPPVANGRGT